MLHGVCWFVYLVGWLLVCLLVGWFCWFSSLLCTAIWRGRIWERAGNERHAAESGEGMDKDIEGALNRKMEKMGEGFVISVRHNMPGVGCVMICWVFSFVVSKCHGVCMCGIKQSTVLGLTGPENQGTLIF